MREDPTSLLVWRRVGPKKAGIMSKPPKHGVIKVSKMKVAHAKQHLAMMTDHAQIARDYGGHGCFSPQGAFSPGGAAGADYQTSSADSVGDADSTGATGY
jgi:hypothetical protein